jgi:hypothetical protein
MRFEEVLLYWLLLTLGFSLILGGVPWRFPENGKIWIQKYSSAPEGRSGI